MTMSDRLAVMRHGKIEQLGHPEDVYDSPATQFVAAFLGASNLLDGEVEGNTDHMTTVALRTGDKVRVPNDRLPPDAGTTVKVGVRPEKITIVADGGVPASDVNSVTGLLRMATYIGVSHQYKVEGPGGAVLTVYVQNLGAGPAPGPGDTVRLTWKPEHTFVVKPSDEPPIEEEEES